MTSEELRAKAQDLVKSNVVFSGGRSSGKTVMSQMLNDGKDIAQWALDALDVLEKARSEFEADNDHFMAAMIECLQLGSVEKAMEVHALYVRFMEDGHNEYEELIDKRELIVKSLQGGE